MKKIYYILLVFTSITLACQKNENDVTSDMEFFKIYNIPEFTASYYAVDIKQTPDLGYLILASYYNDASNYVWLETSVIKIDKTGNFEWEIKPGAQYVNPVGSISEINNELYFFCMDANTLGTHILKIDQTAQTVSSVNYNPDITYPLVSTQESGNVVLQAYDRLGRATTITKFNTDFSVAWQNSISLIEDGEALMINHITRRGKQYPFFITSAKTGNTPDYYLVNGFYQYTFSLLFINASTGAMTGVHNGYRYEGATSSAVQLSDNNFGISYFFRGNNYIINNHTFNSSGISTIENLTGLAASELKTDATVYTKIVTKNNIDYIIYAATTTNNSIVFYTYEKSTGKFVNRYLNSAKNPIDLGAMYMNESAVVITGQTRVFGNIPRIFVSKIPIENLIP